jgi:GntR family transcriptional regulator
LACILSREGPAMLIRIEASSGIPITRQIVDQVRARCASGALRPADRLPSVRELARQLAVNQNTILRAYERLTAEGLLELRHGEGTFVADFATARQLKKERAAFEDDVERLARRAADLRISPEALHAMVDEALIHLQPSALDKARG